MGTQLPNFVPRTRGGPSIKQLSTSFTGRVTFVGTNKKKNLTIAPPLINLLQRDGSASDRGVGPPLAGEAGAPGKRIWESKGGDWGMGLRN